jgi:hypothetical protein
MHTIRKAARAEARGYLGIVVVVCAAALLGGCKREEPPAAVDSGAYAKAPSAPEASTRPTRALPVFVDVTEEAGLDFVHYNGAFGKKWMPETLGSGGGFLDYDGDGHPDILLINSRDWPGRERADFRPTPKLYRNDGTGRFEDVTEEAGLEAISFYGMGFCAADFDGDGQVDLFLTGVRRNYLLHNEDGRFVDITETHLHRDEEAAGEAPDWSLGCAWFDYDLDGHLDLIVVNYVSWTPETDVFTTLDGMNKSYATPVVYEGQTSRLFRNRGDGHLVEATREAGLLNTSGKSMGVIIDDFNADFRPDIFITNDTEPNFLYLNRGGGRFEEVALDAGCAYDEDGRARAGMGVDSAYVSRDTDVNVAIGNFSREPVSLYQRLPQAGLFVDGAGKARLSGSTLLSLTFGLVFADFDHDGYVDLMLANGHIEPEINSVQKEVTFAQKPQLFRNDGTGRFEEITDQVRDDFAVPVVGRALAYADIDGDGDLDVLLTVNNGRPRLFRNDLATNHHALRVRLRGAGRNRDAIGAMVFVMTPTGRQIRWVRTGGSYLSQSELTATFGLGLDSQATIDVRWPSGRAEVLGELGAGFTYIVEEGKGVRERIAFRR